MMSERLYDIGESLREHLESTPFIDDETGEVDEAKLAEWEAGIQEHQGEFKDKLEAIGIVALEMKGDAEKLKAEIDRLRSRKSSLENRRTRLLGYAHVEMVKAGIGKHRSPRDIFTVYLQKGPDRIEVETPTALPDAYQKITIEPRKALIKAAVKVGKFDDEQTAAAGIHVIEGLWGVRYK